MSDNKENKNNKFDINSILSNLKNMINPDMETPEPVSGDAIGEKMKSISEKFQEMAKQHAEHTQTFHELNHLMNALYKDIEKCRTQHPDCCHHKDCPNHQPGKCCKHNHQHAENDCKKSE